MSNAARRVLPGFGLGLGYTILYLSLLVMIPLAAAAVTAADLSFADFCAFYEAKDLTFSNVVANPYI